MRWDPDHIRHIACAGRLYSLLLQQQEGVHFLQTDARGGVLQVIDNKAQPSLFACMYIACLICVVYESSGLFRGTLAGYSRQQSFTAC